MVNANEITQLNILLFFSSSFFLSFFITPFVIIFAEKIGIVDDPKKSSHPKIIHKYPVPRGGGLGIFISVLVSTLIFIPLDKHLVGILVGALAITTLGIVDDKFDMNPYTRLLMQFIIAAIPISFGIGISFISNPLGGIIDLSNPQISFELLGKTRSIWILSDLFALFWIVGLMNFINMGAKGVDGQLPGVVGIAALAISVLSLKFSADITQWPIITLAIITSGAYLGFLPWNYSPQKIMPSYSGSTLAGYLLAILSILSTAKVGTLIVVLGIPLIDTFYVVGKRVFSGKSPVWGDATHLHHRLLNIGWSKRKVSTFYWACTALLGVIAVCLNTSQKFYTMIGVAFLLGGFIVYLNFKNEKK